MSLAADARRLSQAQEYENGIYWIRCHNPTESTELERLWPTCYAHRRLSVTNIGVNIKGSILAVTHIEDSTAGTKLSVTYIGVNIRSSILAVTHIEVWVSRVILLFSHATDSQAVKRTVKDTAIPVVSVYRRKEYILLIFFTPERIQPLRQTRSSLCINEESRFMLARIRPSHQRNSGFTSPKILSFISTSIPSVHHWEFNLFINQNSEFILPSIQPLNQLECRMYR